MKLKLKRYEWKSVFTNNKCLIRQSILFMPKDRAFNLYINNSNNKHLTWVFFYSKSLSIFHFFVKIRVGGRKAIYCKIIDGKIVNFMRYQLNRCYCHSSLIVIYLWFFCHIFLISFCFCRPLFNPSQPKWIHKSCITTDFCPNHHLLAQNEHSL